jgi:indolepyruvate ferredoxin oxidoreductase beta subunit
MDTLAPAGTVPTAAVTDKPLSIAIQAMGGQGGGVLADWIIAVAESQGWAAQTTSVPGVAQRTGATIYYLEMLPARDGRLPIFSLMPMPGDVDVVLAAEWMEAGRSMLRGLVTPDRTLLIASTHRMLATAEKIVPGDGSGNSTVVAEAAKAASRRLIAFDMQAMAEAHGSVVSATMFGALAASGALPFPRSAFEDAIRAGGTGVEASLRAFAAAFERAASLEPEKQAAKPVVVLPAATGHAALDALVARIRDGFPAALHPILLAGTKKLADYQDPAYAGAYLDRLSALLARDRAAGGDAKGFALTAAAAKYVANAMAYDDVIRVANLKVRASRFDRVRREIGVAQGQLLATTEFMHPRGEEVVGMMPAGLGRWIEAHEGLARVVDRLVNRPRRVRTGTIFWFALLYGIAGLKSYRLRTLRHAQETAHLQAWLGQVDGMIDRNYALAVEMLNARRLVKGYSDTHARGTSKFDRVMAMAPLLAARDDGGDWLRRLREAALLDEQGKELDGAILTVKSLN